MKYFSDLLKMYLIPSFFYHMHKKVVGSSKLFSKNAIKWLTPLLKVQVQEYS